MARTIAAGSEMKYPSPNRLVSIEFPRSSSLLAGLAAALAALAAEPSGVDGSSGSDNESTVGADSAWMKECVRGERVARGQAAASAWANHLSETSC